MTAARRLLLVGLSANILFFLAPLTSCGGGNGSGSSTSTAQSSTPAFSSTPVTAASQGTAYTYQVTASDPAGSAITYALTSAPTGATISGNTVNWTPTGAQSRVSNSFTVTATTSGGSATQSWTVTPTGTITINSFNTNWTSSGPVQFPGGFPMGAAVIPNADGSFTVLPGSASSPGVFTIPNVPAGYFWLTTGINLSGFSNSIWTSSGTIDLGQDIPGPSTALTTAQNTTFDFDLSGLDATTPASLVEIATDSSLAPIFYLNPSPAATTVSWSSTANSPVDWSKIDTAFPCPLAPLTPLCSGPSSLCPHRASLTAGPTRLQKRFQQRHRLRSISASRALNGCRCLITSGQPPPWQQDHGCLSPRNPSSWAAIRARTRSSPIYLWSLRTRYLAWGRSRWGRISASTGRQLSAFFPFFRWSPPWSATKILAFWPSETPSPPLGRERWHSARRSNS
jgi:hypothetical protein